jgi:MerR family mercuric resistance operon transcriptional regulator
MSTETLRSRQVADAAGVNIETLRYYERRGILRPPRRNRAGYRQYDQEAVDVVRFIKRAQSLGFTLEEVEELLALRRPRAGRCATVQKAAIAKIDQIDIKLRALNSMRTALAELVAACTDDAATLACPLLEALTDEAGA